jgi:hypothetical protein
MSMRFKGGVISATAPTITAPVGGEGGTASGSWTLQTQLQNSAVWPKPLIVRNLYSWGNNTEGNLGSNNTVKRSSPVQVGSLSTWLKIAAYSYSSYAIKTDGTLWAWGDNNYGALGLGDVVKRSSPVQVGALTTWSQVAAGGAFAAAIKTDGTLWMWGYNSANGNLGLGDKIDRSSPVQVGALTTWANVACGANFATAIKTDGTLWAWGGNPYGALGQGNTTYRSSPVQVGALTTWSKASAGSYHAVAIKTDGTFWSWGLNNNGQLGLNDVVYRSLPVQVGALTTWLSLSANAAQFTSATKTDGTLWAWGVNASGQLGLGDVVKRSSPVQVGALTTWDKIAVIAGNAAAIKTDGTLWLWGDNNYGQLGQSDIVKRSSPVQVGSLTTWLNVAPTGVATLAISS